MIHCELIAPVGELIHRHARRAPDKIAYEDRQTSVTYGELEKTTANLAGQFTGQRYLAEG